MKHTLTVIAAVSLLALTGCGSNDDSEAAPEATTADASPHIEPALKTADELEPNPDGHELHVMFQWIPDVEDPQPVEAKYHMHTSESDGMVYHTPIMEYDVLPSMDSGQYESFVYEVPDGGHAAGSVTITDPPNTGRIACMIVEAQQRVVLDYQESPAGDTEVGCYGFTEQGNTYDFGTPPPEVTF